MSDKARAKGALRALVPSDVTRPRTLAIASGGAALGVALAALAADAPAGTERAVARPHATVACAKCHEAASSAPRAVAAPFHVAAACTTCHGTSHASTRPAHRALAGVRRR